VSALPNPTPPLLRAGSRSSAAPRPPSPPHRDPCVRFRRFSVALLHSPRSSPSFASHRDSRAPDVRSAPPRPKDDLWRPTMTTPDTLGAAVHVAISPGLDAAAVPADNRRLASELVRARVEIVELRNRLAFLQLDLEQTRATSPREIPTG